MNPPSPSDILAGIPVFASFAQIADPGLYAPVPDDWVVGISDVVKSGEAIRAGRYKAVNMAGAAVISAISNAVGHGAFPFVFGGDGASYAMPADRAATARAAMAATATFVAEELGLILRVAEIPVRAIREVGLDLRVARFEASPNVAYAMFSGGGLTWAEEQVKAGRFAVAAAPPGTRPDLNGLSCRFDEMPSRRGTMLSLIVRPAASADPDRYRSLIEAVLALIEGSEDMSNPIPANGPKLHWPVQGMDAQARMMRPPGGSLTLARLKVYLTTAFVFAVMRWNIPVGRFRPKRYMRELIENSDYRKYDDGLRMTIDCPVPLADRIEARLDEAARAGHIQYGTHRQAAATMTCFTPSPAQNDHIHFIDGASGGYAAAAAKMKAAA